MYCSMVSLNSTDDTICNVSYIVTLCTVVNLFVGYLQATLASGPGFLRRDLRIHYGQQEVYCKLWGTAEKPPANLHVGDNVQVYNVQVRTFRSIVSLSSTDDTICKVCHIVTLRTVVILALLLPKSCTHIF